jgi:hypothetical protein
MKLSRRKFNLGLLCSGLVSTLLAGVHRYRVKRGWVLRSDD